MDINRLKVMPLWQMTGEELLYLTSQSKISEVQNSNNESDTSKQLIYGLAGLAKLLGCSVVTASRIKKSKKIDAAITQIGRKIIIDSKLALELAGAKNGGRKK